MLALCHFDKNKNIENEKKKDVEMTYQKVASFPGPTYHTASDRKLGGAWE